MITCLNEEITLEKCEKVLGVTPVKKMKEFLDNVMEKKYKELIKLLDEFWSESLEIELFFKDFAKYCKTLMSKSELEVNKGLEIIGAVYDSLNKFKYEEDKRMVGYVVINNLLSSKTNVVQEKIVEKIIEKPVTVYKDSSRNEESIDLSGITLEYVISQWKDIVEEAKKEKITLGAFLISAKPYKIEGDTLFIGFEGENSFAKEQMETNAYDDVFLRVVRKIINSKIKVKYVLVGKKKEVNKGENDFTKKIVDFFGGEIMK